MPYPKVVDELIGRLKKLPGLGAKSAERVVLHLLKSGREDVMALSRNLEELQEKVRPCSLCFNLTERDPCSICANPARRKDEICVVEGPHDVEAIEKTARFRGLYHVLLGLITPLEGIGPDDLKIKELVERCRKGEIREIILATNPSAEGEATALYITGLIKPFKIRVTLLARGLPVGSELEFVDSATISQSLENRKEVEI